VTTETPETKVATFVLDKDASRFTVRAFASGMLSALGHNPTIAIREFSGEVTFDPGDPEKTCLRMLIRADSLTVTDDIRGKDRQEMESTMKQRVLETSTFPTIEYKSTHVSADPRNQGRFTIEGDLSLHGATHGLTLRAHANAYGDVLRSRGEFSILQSDYGIPLVSVAGGTLKLKDELKFAFEIVARRQD
jgi:polyisoprenoid-binding protein YceI